MTAPSGTTTYSYDGENRLIGANPGGSYRYDAAGNLTGINGTTLSYNAANELTSAGSTTYGFDANGNETGNSAGLSLGYNDANQTTSIDGTSQSYLGQGQTQRVSSGSTTYQDNLTSDGPSAGTGPGVPSGPLPDASISPLGLPIPVNLTQPGTDFPPLAGPFGASASISSMTTSAGTTAFTRLPDGTLIDERVPSGGSTSPYYYLTDGNGSVLALTDSSGAVQDSYSYDAFGNVTSSSGSVPNPFRFDGGVWDAASGLLKFGTRYYDPSVGRWTQEDPLAGSMQDPQSLDRYGFVGGDPVNFVDLSGSGLCANLGASFGVLGVVAGLSGAEPVATAAGIIAAGSDIAALAGLC